jgi:hypothetical protein
MMNSKSLVPVWVATGLSVASLCISVYIWSAMPGRVDELRAQVEDRVRSRILNEVCNGAKSFYRELGIDFDCTRVESFSEIVEPFFAQERSPRDK